MCVSCSPTVAEPVPRWTVANSQPGAERLSPPSPSCARPTRSLSCASAWKPPACCGGTWPALLTQHRRCAPSGRTSTCSTRTWWLTFRRNYGALPKTDRADAFLIAERIRFGRQLPPPFQVDVRYAPLQRLTRFRFHLAHNLAREKSYFLSFLFLTFSSFGQVQPFGDPFGATSSAVLTELTTEELAQQSLEELAAYLQTQGHGHFADPAALGRDPATGGPRCYRPDKVLAEPLRIVLCTTMANIRSLAAQLKTLDQTIAAELQAIPQTLIRPGPGSRLDRRL